MIHDKIFGKKTFKTVTFGTGDIAVCTSRQRGTELENMIFLIQDVEKPLEEWGIEVLPEGHSSDEIENDAIVLEFNRVESVDTLIRHLQEVKKSMIAHGY